MPPGRFEQCHIVLNANAGSAEKADLAETLVERFTEAGIRATIDADREAPLEARILRAVESEAPLIVAAGGDGTVTAIAEALIGTRKTLAIVPLGTANLLARDLDIPLDIDTAIGAIPDMHVRHIDAGVLNGRVFLHKVVVGLVPGIAAGRERIRHRSGLRTYLGLAAYFLRRLARARPMIARIENGESRTERLYSVAVANNGYDEGFGRFFARSRLDRGVLCLYRIRRLTLADVFRLTIGMLIGRWRNDVAIDVAEVRTVRLRGRKPATQVMIDGEIALITGTLDFSIRPGTVAVLAPPS
ncbi:diacylglycerol/lipid kinase family protein [Martelella endophytica]|uniref:diacylglycerol/lipid kinase family protein n=1 Tax=Martelella endophytica TaxID=1486262 RepID=UPI0005F13264|nr:diacylglycerol kinase family protein [Martelella endophytica]